MRRLSETSAVNPVHRYSMLDQLMAMIYLYAHGVIGKANPTICLRFIHCQLVIAWCYLPSNKTSLYTNPLSCTSCSYSLINCLFLFSSDSACFSSSVDCTNPQVSSACCDQCSSYLTTVPTSPTTTSTAGTTTSTCVDTEDPIICSRTVTNSLKSCYGDGCCATCAKAVLPDMAEGCEWGDKVNILQ